MYRKSIRGRGADLTDLHSMKLLRRGEKLEIVLYFEALDRGSQGLNGKSLGGQKKSKKRSTTEKEKRNWKDWRSQKEDKLR